MTEGDDMKLDEAKALATRTVLDKGREVEAEVAPSVSQVLDVIEEVVDREAFVRRALRLDPDAPPPTHAIALGGDLAPKGSMNGQDTAPAAAIDWCGVCTPGVESPIEAMSATTESVQCACGARWEWSRLVGSWGRVIAEAGIPAPEGHEPGQLVHGTVTVEAYPEGLCWSGEGPNGERCHLPGDHEGECVLTAVDPGVRARLDMATALYRSRQRGEQLSLDLPSVVMAKLETTEGTDVMPPGEVKVLPGAPRRRPRTAWLDNVRCEATTTRKQRCSARAVEQLRWRRLCGVHYAKALAALTPLQRWLHRAAQRLTR